MIDHLFTYTTDYDATLAFYDAVLGALGYVRNREMVAEWDPEWPTRRMCAYGTPQRPIFRVMEVREPATPRHVAFAAADRDAVVRFYEAGLAAGGRDHGAPGLRPQYHPGYYGAFLFDPDGNNVEAVVHERVGQPG